jgi:hypothetical protein
VTTSDLWWHLSLGRWLAENRTLPDYTQFYFTPLAGQVHDLRWTVLGDLLLYAVHQVGGVAGIQALAFLCVAAGCVLLRQLHRGPMNGWITLLLVFVAIGTYQLQLPRNAVFSLPLTALILALFAWFQRTRRVAVASLLPGAVGIWSFVHGSYLLGCALVGWLLFTDVLAGRGAGWAEVRRRALVAGALLTVTLALVSIGNPLTGKMLQRPFRAVFGEAAKPAPAAVAKKPRRETSAAARRAAEQPQATPTGIASWLNNLIWRPSTNAVQSADFNSPFERLSYRPVAVAFGLMALGACWAAFAKGGPALSWLGAFAATSLLGLSYFRMTGYASLGAGALMLATPLRPRIAGLFARRGYLGVALTCAIGVIVWGAVAGDRLPSLLGNDRHVIAIGQIPTFDDAACDWLYAHHRERRVFTTIVTGSYAGFSWKGEMPVFTDGFFEPHAKVGLATLPPGAPEPSEGPAARNLWHRAGAHRARSRGLERTVPDAAGLAAGSNRTRVHHLCA